MSPRRRATAYGAGAIGFAFLAALVAMNGDDASSRAVVVFLEAAVAALFGAIGGYWAAKGNPTPAVTSRLEHDG